MQTQFKVFNFNFDDDFTKKASTGKPQMREHTKEEFANWMASDRPWPFPKEQLTITPGIIEFAYKMYIYAVRVNNGTIIPNNDEITADFVIPFQTTQVNIQLNELGMRALKTIYNGDVELLYNEEDFWVPKLLNIYDDKGRLQILQFRDVEEQELESLFLTYGWAYFGFQMISCVPMLDLSEIMDSRTVPNQELRARILVEPHAAKLLANQLTTVDTYTHTKHQDLKDPTKTRIDVYQLKKGKIDSEDVVYVNCYCPSTGRDFMLGVDKRYTNAKDAVASLLRMPKGLLEYVDTIHRQGEVFIATYKGINTSTKKFLELNKTELVPLTGDFYFDKIVFES